MRGRGGTGEYSDTGGGVNMKEKASFSTILKYVILCLLVFIYVLPLLWVVFVSLKTNTEVDSGTLGSTGDPAF